MKQAMAGVGFLCLCFCLVIPSSAQTVRSPDERELWKLWKQQQATPDDHDGMLSACAAFSATHGDDPLNAVANGIAVWHKLKLGRMDEAEADLARLLRGGTDGLSVATARMARTWLTRRDREAVQRALKKVYAKHVAFPDSLEPLASLPDNERPPLKDRWGRSWSYQLIGFKALKGLADQKYRIESATLGPDSDMEEALRIPYAARINVEPDVLLDATRGRETMRFKGTPADNQWHPVASEGEQLSLSVGAESQGLSFAYIGRALIVLSDGNHWFATPRPRK